MANESKTLKNAAVGATVKVKKLTGDGPVKRRIMDMGITKGVEVYVRKVAHELIGTCQCVKQSCFTAVWVTC